MLEVSGITVRYGAVPALQDVSLSVGAGELVSLIGANGAGKSTALKAISGLLPLAAGRITLDGEALSGQSPRAVLARGVAHCPEGRRVFPHLTVAENLEMGAYLRRDRAAVRQDRERQLDRFPRLRERWRQPAGTLSGGEQQMLAIVRALMSRPRLVLFDEPSLGLAPTLVAQTFEIIREVRAAGATVLLVEQNAAAALAMADRGYVLETGRMVRSGTGAALLRSDEVRAAYLGQH